MRARIMFGHALPRPYGLGFTLIARFAGWLSQLLSVETVKFWEGLKFAPVRSPVRMKVEQQIVSA